MTSKQIIAEIKSKGLPFNTPVFKLKVIDGEDGSADVDYFLSIEERDSDCEGIQSPYFFERSTITFKESAFS